MQVSVETVGNHERRLTVSLPGDRLQSQIGSRLRELSRSVRIKGFRPGKVPAKVIEQRYGEQVRAEALGELVRSTLNAAIDQEKLRPAAAPRIESAGEEGDEVRVVATFEVIPELGTIDVSGLAITRPVAEVTDADVDRMIETLRLQRRTWEPVERAAQDGDLVQLESSAQAGDVRLPAEGAERGTTILGSGVLLPAMEAALKDLKAGDEADVEVEFPADWRVQALAGKTATVHVKVESVSAPQLPEVDEAFIRSFGIKSGDIEQFRKDVRGNLERELKGALMNRLRAEVVEKLVAAYASTEFPPRLIEAEARAMSRQAEQQSAQQGRPGEKIAHENFLPAASRRVAAGLLLGEIARQNELRLDPKRVSETLALIASTYEEPEQVVELYRQDPNLMSSLQTRVMEEQVIDWVASHADVTEQTLSFDELMRPA
ncbi:trigger factor [Coralloluteibacterium thermophilus]|uniref:Trigger factor n=1 Tax=Coralloluteibacterium thermophilum TaxID=2707049 RepID=A0ABV9NH32_9GAMM